MGDVITVSILKKNMHIIIISPHCRLPIKQNKISC